MALECVTSTARRHRLTRRERLLQPAAIGACFSLFGPSGYPSHRPRPGCLSLTYATIHYIHIALRVQEANPASIHPKKSAQWRKVQREHLKDGEYQ